MVKRFTQFHFLRLKSILLISLLALFSIEQSAAPAYPGKLLFTQPDGSSLSLYLKGDEFFHFYETEDGAMVVLGDRQELCYATVDAAGRIVASDIPASDVGRRSSEAISFLVAQEQSLLRKLAAQSNDVARQKLARRANPGRQPIVFPTKGTVRGLIILAEYEDVKFTSNATRDLFNRMANEENYSGPYASGSIRDYFIAQSNGQFTPEFDVVGPVTLPHKMEYYGIEEKVPEMIVDACTQANSDFDVDFTQYDADGDETVDFVFVIYAGYGESQGGSPETVWPAKFDMTYESWKTFDGLYLGLAACSCELHGNQGETIDGIGTFCHEFSHILGLPDIYDTGLGTGFGMAQWDIMDRGIYNDESRTPAGYTLMDKYSVGWIEPEILSEARADIALTALSEGGNGCFIVCESDDNEYYTLENRQQTGWDAGLKGHGLLISHIHYVPNLWASNRVNASTSGYEHVSLVAADNNKAETSFEGDPFPGLTGNVLFANSTKPAMTWHVTSDEPQAVVSNIREENGRILFDFNATGTAINDATLHDYSGEAGQADGIFTIGGSKMCYGSPDDLRLDKGVYIIKKGGKSRKLAVN